MPQSQVHNTDCIQFMQSLPDNYFDLAIADPPYGDAGQNNANPHVDLGSRSRKYLKDTEITPPHNSCKVQTTNALRIRNTKMQGILHEPAEHGQRNTQKNSCVGHGTR